MQPKNYILSIILLAVTTFSFPAAAQAQGVNPARDAFYDALRAHADGAATLRHVERAYDRLQRAKRERDAKEKLEEQQRKQRMSNRRIPGSGNPPTNYRLNYGRGLNSFSPEVSFATQIGDVETAPIEYRAGDEQSTVRKLNGMNKYGNITLKSGLSDNVELSEYRFRSGKTN